MFWITDIWNFDILEYSVFRVTKNHKRCVIIVLKLVNYCIVLTIIILDMVKVSLFQLYFNSNS